MSPRLRLLFLTLAVGLCFGAVALGLPSSPAEIRSAVQGFGLLGPVILLGAWLVLTPVLFSGTLLSAAGGLAFGTWIGSGVAVVGAVAGGLAAFAIARRFGHRPVQQLSGPRLERLQARLERRGFLAVLAARVAPGVPSTWLHYASGLARIRTRDFVAGIAIGGTPKVFAYAALGSSGGDLDSTIGIVALSVIAAMAVLGIAIALVARRGARPAAV